MFIRRIGTPRTDRNGKTIGFSKCNCLSLIILCLLTRSVIELLYRSTLIAFELLKQERSQYEKGLAKQNNF
jgi:hypothetical protein